MIHIFFALQIFICSGRKYILKILSRLALQRNEPAAGLLLFPSRQCQGRRVRNEIKKTREKASVRRHHHVPTTVGSSRQDKCANSHINKDTEFGGVGVLQ